MYICRALSGSFTKRSIQMQIDSLAIIRKVTTFMIILFVVEEKMFVFFGAQNAFKNHGKINKENTKEKHTF